MMGLQRVLPADAWNRAALAAFLTLWFVSCIRPPYPKYFWLQHVPTAAVALALVAAESRFRISRFSYSLILAFMALHLLGARYLYSYVPYDYWSEYLWGFQVTERLGFERNHYDRFVHFCFGLLLVVPAWRFARRVTPLGPGWSAVFALSAILSASALYEIFEWLAAMVMAPDWAESFNGQQGDAWDAQRDMALAAGGAAAGLAVAALWWLPSKAPDTVKGRPT